MNEAFVQARPDRTVSPSHTAFQGLRQLGYNVEWFAEKDFDRLPITKDTLVVGFIEVYRDAIERVTGSKPMVFNYPSALATHDFLGRDLWQMDLGTARNELAVRGVPTFIKPADEIKSFAGVVVRGVPDLYRTAGLPNHTPVWASDVVEFKAEYRCFIQNKKILSVRQYKGDPLVFPSARAICRMVTAWKDSPSAYCLDVGVIYENEDWDGTDKRTVLVEVNDAHSAGDYGLDPILYARFLETRWCELTGATPIP
jgi:hypothetical protein